MTRNANYEAITPNLNYLSDQAVIVQAWKKAHAHVRYHNWFADSLELDASALRLRQLVENRSTLLKAGTFSHYAPDPCDWCQHQNRESGKSNAEGSLWVKMSRDYASLARS